MSSPSPSDVDVQTAEPSPGVAPVAPESSRVLPRVAPAAPLPVTIYKPEQPAGASPPRPVLPSPIPIGGADTPHSIPTPSSPVDSLAPVAEAPHVNKREAIPAISVPAVSADAPQPRVASANAPTAPATKKERIPEDLRELLDKGNEDTGLPDWAQPAGWAAVAASALFVLAGLALFSPRDSHVVEVGSPFGVATVDDLNQPGAGEPAFAAEDSIEEAGLEAPDSLGFIEDEYEEETGPVSDAELAEDGLVDDAAPAAPIEEAPAPDDNEAAQPEADDLVADDLVANDPVADDPQGGDLVGDVFLQDNFDTISEKWTPLAGEWIGANGTYAQQSAEGFDQIAQLELDLPERYRVSVTMQPLDGAIGGGLLLGQQTSGERAGAYVLELTDNGTFLSFGVYDGEGTYGYLAGLATPENFDVDVFHELTAFVDESATVVSLDGAVVAEFDPVPTGRMGLITSEAATSFDNLTIEIR